MITGAAGFIGSHLTCQLLDAGCHVSAVIRPGSVPHRLRRHLDRLSIVECDLEDSSACRDLIGRCDSELVLHLGWFAEPGRWVDSDRHLDHLAGSLALLQGVAGTRCRRVIVAGTSVEYQGDFGKLLESSPVRPRTLYGASKASLALIGEQLARQQGWSFAQARVFNVYGPAEDSRRLVPHVIRHLLEGRPCELTTGDQVRDYLHVEDVASALVALAASELEGPVNVASSQPVTVEALAREIAGVCGRPDLLRFGTRQAHPNDESRLVADTRLLRRHAGWSPRFRLEEGLLHTVAWWRDALAG